MKTVSQVVHELGIASLLWVRARRRNAIRDAEPEGEEAFRREISRIVEAAPKGLLGEHRFCRVPANRPPWLDTGIDVTLGEHLTWIATGRTYLSRPLDIWVGPHFQLWARVGADGTVFRGVRDTHSFAAPRSGRLFLASYFPGEWAEPDGRLATPPELYRKVSGSMLALLIRWAGGVTPTAGLRALSRVGDCRGLLESELDHLARPVEPPAGWRHLWFVGPSEIFSPGQTEDGCACIRCDTQADAAILQKDAAVVLEPGTRLRWRWKVDALPSDLPEDTLPTHDYMSIAVEFDNGQDLTYYWSAKLPPGTIYRCPLPTWTHKETHWVVRSGPEGLGRWHEESRSVLDDYRKAIGGAPPTRIIRVWLIALSAFQRQHGVCQYADIALTSGAETVVVA